MTKEVYVVDFSARDGFDQLDVVAASFGGVASVTFDELGAPDASGSVTIQAGPHVYVVNVASATGNVTVSTGS